MKKQDVSIHNEIHAIEDELIQLSGLLEALQLIEIENEATLCLINAIDHQLKQVKHNFYGHWKALFDKK